jgi:hypothetical protein
MIDFLCEFIPFRIFFDGEILPSMLYFGGNFHATGGLAIVTDSFYMAK